MDTRLGALHDEAEPLLLRSHLAVLLEEGVVLRARVVAEKEPIGDDGPHEEADDEARDGPREREQHTTHVHLDSRVSLGEGVFRGKE